MYNFLSGSFHSPLRFFHVVTCIRSSFLLLLNSRSLYGYTTISYRALVDEHLGWFQFAVIMNKADLNFLV